MLTGNPRELHFPLNESVVLENETPDEPVGGRPVFPEDPDVKIIVPIELSANEFKYLASTIDVGRDPAYPDQSQYIWWLWLRVFLPMTLCEAVAQCLIDENEALINALAAALVNNATLRNAISDALSENGGATPGLPLSEESSLTDRLPDNVKNEAEECIPNALWGSMLGLIRGGNRTITDFFEILENASNQFERAEIATGAIPAIGAYIEKGAQFADQLQEEVAESYAANYTEAYEISLACDLFCLALDQCELSIDNIIGVLRARVTAPPDDGDFLEIMNWIITGGFTGDEVVDAAFIVYFTGVKFGQQFADNLGVRPFTTMMGNGAESFASGQWAENCECATIWNHDIDFTGASMPAGWTVVGGAHSVGNGVSITADQGGGLFFGRVSFDPSAAFHCNSFRLKFTSALTDSFGQIFSPSDGSSFEFNFVQLAGGETFQDATGLPDTFSADAFLAGVAGATANTMYLTGVRITGDGFDPFA